MPNDHTDNKSDFGDGSIGLQDVHADRIEINQTISQEGDFTFPRTTITLLPLTN